MKGKRQVRQRGAIGTFFFGGGGLEGNLAEVQQRTEGKKVTGYLTENMIEMFGVIAVNIRDVGPHQLLG